MALLQFPIPHHCAPVSFNTSAWGSPAAAFASHSRRGVSNVGVGLPTSLWAALLRLSSPRHRVMSNVGTVLPTTMWAAVLRHSCALIVVCCQTLGLGGVRLPVVIVGLTTSLWAALLRLSSPRHHVVLNVVVGLPT